MRLLVGGIGIMTIMLVFMTERTREIGIRLAIGAYEHEVLQQFLSFFGGILGIILAQAASYGATTMLSIPFVWMFPSLLSPFFKTAVGVMFGYFLELKEKAAPIDAIDVLRHE